MHTKAKSRLTILLILLSFAVVSIVSITAIFALTQQNTKTRVDIIYTADTNVALLTFTLSDDETSYSVTGCDTSITGKLTIPSTYNGKPVTSIEEWAFYNCSGLTEMTIKDNVTNIGSYAFKGCSGLTVVSIGNEVNNIDDWAFSDCVGLVNIEVLKGNTAYSSVENCLIETASKTLILGCNTSVIPTDGSVISIGPEAFLGCSGLTEIIIPDSVCSIAEWAFTGCDGLTEIVIPDNVTSIGQYAFFDCIGLKSIIFENTEGWWCSSSLSATSGTSLSSTDLANASTAATYLRETYYKYYWKRS